MRAKLGWGLVWGAVVIGFFGLHPRNATAGNCALYARAITGVDLYGAAGGWWYEAIGRYQRGQVPAQGSILVFRPTRATPSGHVAVVSQIVGPSMVLVDQSNWYHGRVTLGTPVIDTSPNHDWTRVSVMNLDSGQFGRDNPTFGFVYPQSGANRMLIASDVLGFGSTAAATHIGFEGSGPAALPATAVEDEYWQSGRSRRWAHRKAARHALRFGATARTHSHRAWHSHHRTWRALAAAE